MDDEARKYLRDAFSNLVERAREARRSAAEADLDSETRTFQQGRAQAYYEVVDHLLHQLDAFGIERSSVGVDPGFDPDRELL